MAEICGNLSKNALKQPAYIIVGGGLAGTSLALELLRRGITPLLIDQWHESSSSRLAAGLVNPIVPRGVRKTWKADLLFNLIPEWYAYWEKELQAAFFSPMQMVQLHPDVHTANEWARRTNEPGFETYLKASDSYSCPPVIHEPFGHSIIHCAGRLNTGIFLDAAQRYIRERAVIIEAPFEYQNLTAAEDHWQYGDLKVQKVIFCEGIRAMNNPWFSYLHFHPTGGDILTVRVDGLNSRGEQKIYKRRQWLVPADDGLWLLGGNFHKGDLSETTRPADADQLVSDVSKWIHADITVVEHRRGVRPTVEGRRPYLGEHPDHPGLFIFNGLGSKGSSLIPWLAPMMAGWLTGHGGLDPETDISRFASQD